MQSTHPPVIVRTYEDRDRRKAARAFEEDAQGLDREGYDVASVTRSDATSVLSWWAWPAASTALTVKYVRRAHH
jgi:hypothetical protein